MNENLNKKLHFSYYIMKYLNLKYCVVILLIININFFRDLYRKKNSLFLMFNLSIKPSENTVI